MKITGFENDNSVLSELGSRIKQYRVSENLTQDEFAAKCGISTSTLVRIEKGEDSKLSNIIRIMRQLNILSNIDLIIPETEPDYREFYEKKPARKRAGKRSKDNTLEFVWGKDKKLK